MAGIWAFCRKKILLLPMVFFLVCFLLVPDGLARMESIADTGDGSVFNRLLIWQGGFGILADYWLTGTGMNTPGEIYTMWYQPLWLNERYHTLVNDWLTIGTVYGIFLLLGYLALVFIVVWLAGRAWQQNRNIFLLCAAGGVVSYQIASCFSTLYLHWTVFVPFLLLCFGVAVTVAVQYRRGRLRFSLKDPHSVTIAPFPAPAQRKPRHLRKHPHNLP